MNLLRAGVDPDHILAMTFTRKAAAEMRERIIARLREASRCSALDLARWRDLKDRLGDISISTIDAFCLSLLREFPLEADVDPGFELADDTEVPRLIGESLDKALRICRAVARDDDVALVFAQLGSGAQALRRRWTAACAPQALRVFFAGSGLTAACVPPGGCAGFARRWPRGASHARDGLARHPQFVPIRAEDIGRLASGEAPGRRQRGRPGCVPRADRPAEGVFRPGGQAAGGGLFRTGPAPLTATPTMRGSGAESARPWRRRSWEGVRRSGATGRASFPAWRVAHPESPSSSISGRSNRGFALVFSGVLERAISC